VVSAASQPRPSALELARKYAVRGWRPFPVEPRGKRPKVIDPGPPQRHFPWGHRTKNAPTDAQLVEWFDSPDLNVGIAQGPSGLLTIDADRPTALAQAAADRNALIPTTYTVRTSKGRHYVFADPDGEFGNSPGALKAYGCDVRGGQGHGGYVLAAGSVHPDGTVYTVETEAQPAPVPPWIKAMLREQAQDAIVHTLPPVGGSAVVPAVPSQVSNADEPARRFTEAQARAFIATEILDPLQAAKRGERNERLNACAMLLGHFVPGGFLSEATAMAWLERNAPESLVRDDGLASVRATIRSGLKAGMASWTAELAEPAPVLDGVGESADDEPDTWAPLSVEDMEAILDGAVAAPEPAVGLSRVDGATFLYPGREHALIGEMEAGKSWFALACCAEELKVGERVIYVHFEESDPAPTLLRLHQNFRVERSALLKLFTFIGPERRVTSADVERLCDPAPHLVVLDGVNEAMALHGQKIMEPEGAAEYRRRLVKPFTKRGAAVLSLDHVPKDPDGRASGYAFGSVHKGNGLTGAMLMLENRDPFGEGRLGVSRLYVTKDRPGKLRRLGRPSESSSSASRKFFLGSFVIDSRTDDWGWSMTLPRPADDGPDPEFEQMREERAEQAHRGQMDADVLAGVVAQSQNPNITAVSARKVCEVVKGYREADIRKSLSRLESAGLIRNDGFGRTPSWSPTSAAQ
jgi:hypothetical protein